ncbi:MAG: ATP-binding protein [Bacteroidota bacterium]
MRTQTKLLISLLITALLLFSGFLIILKVQKQQNAILLQSGIEQQNSILKTAIEAKSDLIYRTVYDYTYWDAMIEYMNTSDELWAEDNLYTLFSSFHVNGVWLYTLELKPVFREAREDSVEIEPIDIPQSVFPILYRNKFIRFYLQTPSGIFEIYGATLHPSDDEARKSPPRGYFFMAKLLNQTYLSEMEKLTGGDIKLTESGTANISEGGNSIVTSYPLKGWNNEVIGMVELSREYDSITIFKSLSAISIFSLIGLALVILVNFIIAFSLLVNIPLNRISQALLTKSSEDRLRLKTLKSEFKKIGILIDNYFEQQEALEIEIDVRKKTEAQKEKLISELDSANRELKDFAYIVSHDLKAPLRAIGSISQWIHTDYIDKLDEDGKMQLDLLLSRVHRMQNLIEGVLAYSRVTRTVEEKEQIDLNILVREAIEMVAPPEKFNITIDTNLPTVSFGPTRLLQVFENLVSNAVKYNDKETGEINIRCVDQGKAWAFSVSDNGPGIEEKYYEKIFQIFQTLRARDEFESTGIGLTIVKKIIENNGGTIHVDSAPGNGTTFTFTILK